MSVVNVETGEVTETIDADEARRLTTEAQNEFRSSRELSGLDITERRLAVRTMTEWGLSTRAIAQPLGVDHSTIVRDVARGASAPPDAEPTFVSATEALAALGTQDASPDAEDETVVSRGVQLVPNYKVSRAGLGRFGRSVVVGKLQDHSGVAADP